MALDISRLSWGVGIFLSFPLLFSSSPQPFFLFFSNRTLPPQRPFPPTYLGLPCPLICPSVSFFGPDVVILRRKKQSKENLHLSSLHGRRLISLFSSVLLPVIVLSYVIMLGWLLDGRLS